MRGREWFLFMSLGVGRCIRTSVIQVFIDLRAGEREGERNGERERGVQKTTAYMSMCMCRHLLITDLGSITGLYGRIESCRVREGRG